MNYIYCERMIKALKENLKRKTPIRYYLVVLELGSYKSLVCGFQ